MQNKPSWILRLSSLSKNYETLTMGAAQLEIIGTLCSVLCIFGNHLIFPQLVTF